MSLRVGVAWEADRVSPWRRTCVDRLVAVPGVELALVIDLSLSPEQLDRIRGADLDLILHLADARPPAGLGSAARFGVWTIHHGDGTVYSPGPVTEWEPHCRGPLLHAALIATLDGGSRSLALQEGCLRITSTAWSSVLEGPLRCVAEWPAKVCREALDLGEPPLARGRPASFAPALRRSAARGLRRRLSRWASGTRWLLRKGLDACREDQWAIGVVRAPIHSFLDAHRERTTAWLPERSRHEYVADPFGLRTARGLVILGERFDHRLRRGEICTIASPDGRRFDLPSTALALPAHMSYPYLFEHDGALYCIPEMFQSGGIQLFEFLVPSGTWRFVATLIEGTAGVDPTFLRHGNRLWLFFTTRDDGAAVLHLWWAPALAGPWRPHRRSPVKFDVRSARPAGTPFEHGGQIFRPSQDCSETYGGAIRINRILRLTADEFDEETVAVLRPDANGPYPAGLHTLSAFDEWTLIDGKRRRWRLPWRPKEFASPDLDGLRQRLGRLRADTIGLDVAALAPPPAPLR